MDQLRAVALDSFETSFAMEGLVPRLLAVGLYERDLPLLFAHALRDGFALEVSGTFQPFRQVLGGAIAVLLGSRGLDPSGARVEHVLEGLAMLEPHFDLVPAVKFLRARGIRVIVLTNGAEQSTWKLVRNAGLDADIEQVVSIDTVHHFKPAREVYLSAVQRLRLAPANVALFAAHPWDVHGAKRAGLVGGFVRRKERLYPSAMLQPDLQGDSLMELAQALVGAQQRAAEEALRH